MRGKKGDGSIIIIGNHKGKLGKIKRMKKKAIDSLCKSSFLLSSSSSLVLLFFLFPSIPFFPVVAQKGFKLLILECYFSVAVAWFMAFFFLPV